MMGLTTILRVAAIIGSIIWSLSLIQGWNAYTEISSLGGSGLFASDIESAHTSLITQTILAGLLMLFGIFYKGTPSKGLLESITEDGELIQEINNPPLFKGDRYLHNDAYKIYLTKKYGIEKNEALNQIICKDKLFDSVSDALDFANKEEQKIQNQDCFY